MNKVLLTGASGFLGASLSGILLNNGDKLVTLGRSLVNDYRIDLANEVPVLNECFDVVIHAAGKAHSIPKTYEEERDFFDVNLKGTINLCKSLENLDTKPKAFIYISTVAVYGLDHGIEITEDYPLLGTSPYARSKIEAEEFLEKWATKSAVQLSILRLPLIAGNEPVGNLKMMINGIKSNRYLSIGKASARKSIVWADDIGELVPELCKMGGVYNLTDQYHPSFCELETEIANALGKRNPLKIPIFIAGILGGIGDLIGAKFPVNSDKIKKITSTLTFSDLKAKEKLGWKPTKVLDQIKQIV